MSKTKMRVGPRTPRLGWFAYYAGVCWTFPTFRRAKVYGPTTRFAQRTRDDVCAKLERGETVYLAGVGPAGHNSGVSLVSAHKDAGITLLSNDEEERFTGVKHCEAYPEQGLELLKQRLADVDLTPSDIDAWLLTWDYPKLSRLGFKAVFEHFPRSFGLLSSRAMATWHFFRNARGCRRFGRRVRDQFGLDQRVPTIAMPHHDNHAAASFALSPFASSEEPVMITVIDGFGDEGAMSLYVAENGKLKPISKNHSIVDSLGAFYSIISSTKGGWTTLSSEGRYMGAAAWGDRNRLTNPFYSRMRQLIHFGQDGEIRVNRAMANWHNHGERKPFKKLLEEVIGPRIPIDDLWNPDAVLNVSDVQHSEITRERVDLAAATQMVFEDAIFHIVGHFIRKTKSQKLVMTGGTALNCLANMKLLDHFDEEWYRRNLGETGRLHLWVPPTPGDAGVTYGAAFNFAMQCGAPVGKPMNHAFYCGQPAKRDAISTALESAGDIGYLHLDEPDAAMALADFASHVVANDRVVGIYQGAAETGPRALGHRSILANPRNPKALDTINRLVKFREPIRPLAPMATLRDAKRFFELSDGASDDNYNAYNYMVLTAQAKPEAHLQIPAVVHKDGTARVQIVRPECDPFCHEFLKSMGTRVGVEVAVNTSLNVGSPIVQTPEQALEALRRAKALTVLILIADDGTGSIAWKLDESAEESPAAIAEDLIESWQAERASTDRREPAASMEVAPN